MYVLGMESSCDETSAAVVEMTDGLRAIKSNIVASQIETHRLYGGVVPEIASRAHIEAVSRITKEALDEAGITNVNVTRTSHSNLDGLRSEARQKAMKDAQQRARELAEAVGQSIGACYEISDYTTSVQPVYRKNMLMATATAMDTVAAETEPDVQFEQIEISYSVSAKFYLNTK